MTCEERGMQPSTRRRIHEYLLGRFADEYRTFHPEFVSAHLRIGSGLEVSNSRLSASYLEWVRDRFDPNFTRPFTYDLHNLYLHLIECHGVEECELGNQRIFFGVGLRTDAEH